MYISSFMRYTVKPSVLAIQPKHKNTITIILNKDVPIQEAKTDKFKLLSLSFDEDITKLSYNEQKEKFKSVNYKEIGYPIDLTSKYIERPFRRETKGRKECSTSQGNNNNNSNRPTSDGWNNKYEIGINGIFCINIYIILFS